MVGVPGRSKGCHACRKRKVACSQERPECAICLKAGRQCPGYQRERIFVYVGPKGKETSATTSQAVQRSAERAVERSKGHSPRSEALPSQSSSGDEPSSVAGNASLSPSSTGDVSQSLALALQPSLAATSYRQQLLGTFLAKYEVTMGKNDPRKIITKHWLSMVPERPQLSRALDAAATAFCTAKLGRACSDKSLLAESLRLYGRGLRELQLALWDPHLMYLDDTLGACVLLAMYEVFECPSQSAKGYQSHHDGCARLIQMRGSPAHASGMGHSIFCSFRFMGVLDSFVTKKTFLAEPEWMDVPFTAAPRGPFNLLLDLMLEAPALMRWGDTIGQLGTPGLQLASGLALLQALWDLEERLVAFYAEFEVSQPGELYWTRVSGVEASLNDDQDHEDSDDDLFPVHFAFQNTPVAGLLMLYWACLTMLYAGIVPVHGLIGQMATLVSEDDLRVAQETLPSVSPSFLLPLLTRFNKVTSMAHLLPTLPPFERAMAFGKTGRNVCQSVAFCLQDATDELGMSAITAPLQIVRDTFARWPGFERELVWIAKMQARQARRGVNIVRFFQEVVDQAERAGKSRVATGTRGAPPASATVMV